MVLEQGRDAEEDRAARTADRWGATRRGGGEQGKELRTRLLVILSTISLIPSGRGENEWNYEEMGGRREERRATLPLCSQSLNVSYTLAPSARKF